MKIRTWVGVSLAWGICCLPQEAKADGCLDYFTQNAITKTSQEVRCDVSMAMGFTGLFQKGLAQCQADAAKLGMTCFASYGSAVNPTNCKGGAAPGGRAMNGYCDFTVKANVGPPKLDCKHTKLYVKRQYAGDEWVCKCPGTTYTNEACIAEITKMAGSDDFCGTSQAGLTNAYCSPGKAANGFPIKVCSCTNVP